VIAELGGRRLRLGTSSSTREPGGMASAPFQRTRHRGRPAAPSRHRGTTFPRQGIEDLPPQLSEVARGMGGPLEDDRFNNDNRRRSAPATRRPRSRPMGSARAGLCKDARTFYDFISTSNGSRSCRLLLPRGVRARWLQHRRRELRLTENRCWKILTRPVLTK